MELLAVTGALGAEVRGIDLRKPLRDTDAEKLYQGLDVDGQHSD